MRNCLFLLSTKSSGSSIIQRLVKVAVGGRPIATPHFEEELLFWCKAASIKGVEQVKMPRSVTPYSRSEAFAELKKFYEMNGLNVPEAPDDAFISGGWRGLIEKFGPTIIDKTPHYLYSRELLKYIIAANASFENTRFLFVVIVRNPNDVLYSSWRRFGIHPAIEERLWRTAYSNYFEIRTLSARVELVRYEDIVTSGADPILDILAKYGVAYDESACRDFAEQSIVSSRKYTASRNRVYRFALSPETIRLAERLGYDRDELQGDREQTLISRVALNLGTVPVHKFVPTQIKTLVKNAIER